jgi:adenylate kinase family enzyme
MQTSILREHPRIAVVGTSCSGKTTIAGQLASVLGRTHVELDALHWGSNWSVSPDFAKLVEEAVGADEWIVDGNYRNVRDLIWRRATAIIWLNYPFTVVFRQALTRTLRRLLSQQPLYGGNCESFRGAFLTADGIPWWVIRTHGKRRREYPMVLSQPEYRHLKVFELKSHAEAKALLERAAA